MTTIANLPQLPFDSFNVKINRESSTNSPLLNRDCPADRDLDDLLRPVVDRLELEEDEAPCN
jgi:hypothetical protein